jgi:hypothetical protein
MQVMIRLMKVLYRNIKCRENVSVELLKQMEYRFRKKLLKKSIPTLTPQIQPQQKFVFA